MSKIAALQFPTLSLSESRLDYYLKEAKESGANLVVLGEYVLNSFFADLLTMPKSMIREQSETKKKSLENLAKKYDIEIIAPFIRVEEGGYIKTCLKVSSSSIKTYTQQVLMPYAHWNEEKFFLNKSLNQGNKIKPFSFTYGKLKCALLFGFEVHFDIFWQEIRSKRVDLVIVPCACTFESQKRWEELLKTRAFLNQTSILRVNRIGTARHGVDWKFYGDSFFINAFGEIRDRLGEEEEMLICEPQSASEARKVWAFDRIIKTYIR